MTGLPDHESARAVVRAVLAAVCGCPEVAFEGDGLTIVAAPAGAGPFRFPPPRRPLAVVTLGTGVVVSADAGRLAWLRRSLSHEPPAALFTAPVIARLAQRVARDGQVLRGPELKFVCAADRFRPAGPPPGVTVALVEGEAIAGLYQHAGFDHALAYRRDTARPDMLAAVATVAGGIAGIAAASADSDVLWQIGVDVVAGQRGRGVGRAVVSAVTEAVLARGILPYYSTLVGNLPSTALALGLGYWPAWTQLYARDRPVP